MFKLKILKSLFLIICISLPSLLYGVEVCKIPSGCQIDDKGFCVGCIEQEFEEETEEEILEKKIEEEKDSGRMYFLESMEHMPLIHFLLLV